MMYDYGDNEGNVVVHVRKGKWSEGKVVLEEMTEDWTAPRNLVRGLDRKWRLMSPVGRTSPYFFDESDLMANWVVNRVGMGSDDDRHWIELEPRHVRYACIIEGNRSNDMVLVIDLVDEATQEEGVQVAVCSVSRGDQCWWCNWLSGLYRSRRRI